MMPKDGTYTYYVIQHLAPVRSGSSIGNLVEWKNISWSLIVSHNRRSFNAIERILKKFTGREQTGEESTFNLSVARQALEYLKKHTKSELRILRVQSVQKSQVIAE